MDAEPLPAVPEFGWALLNSKPTGYPACRRSAPTLPLVEPRPGTSKAASGQAQSIQPDLLGGSDSFVIKCLIDRQQRRRRRMAWAPGFTPGLVQINGQVPEGVRPARYR